MALLLAFALPVGATPVTYTFTDLGTLGGDFSKAAAVNNAG